MSLCRPGPAGRDRWRWFAEPPSRFCTYFCPWQNRVWRTGKCLKNGTIGRVTSLIKKKFNSKKMIFPFQGISRDFSFFLLLEAFRKKKIL
jgi:hypothetical protein